MTKIRTFRDANGNPVYTETSTQKGTFLSGIVRIFGHRNELRKTIYLKDKLEDIALNSLLVTPAPNQTVSDYNGTQSDIIIESILDENLNTIATKDSFGNTSGMVLDKADRPVYLVNSTNRIVSKSTWNDDDIQKELYVLNQKNQSTLEKVISNKVNQRGESIETETPYGISKIKHGPLSEFEEGTDTKGFTTSVAYCNVHLPETITNWVGGTGNSNKAIVTKLGYNDDQLLDKIVDARDKEYRFFRTVTGELKELRYPQLTMGPDQGKQHNELFRYNSGGNLLARQHSSGKIHLMKYDNSGRLVKQCIINPAQPINILTASEAELESIINDPSKHNPESVIEYHYDLDEKFYAIFDEITRIGQKFYYNNFGQTVEEKLFVDVDSLQTVVSETTQPEFSIQREYQRGKLEKIKSDNVGTISFSYNNHSSIREILRTAPNQTSQETLAKIFYNESGLKERIEYASGVSISYKYTKTGDLQRIISKKGLETHADIEYFRNEYGDISKIKFHHLKDENENVTVATFEYKPIVRWLVAENWNGLINYSARYEYDKTGNRTSSDILGQLLENGQQKTKKIKQTITYDDENRIISEEATETEFQFGQIGQESLIPPSQIIVDSENTGWIKEKITDGDTTDELSSNKAWRSADTNGQHFAGYSFAENYLLTKAEWYKPTIPNDPQSSKVSRFKVQAKIGQDFVDIEPFLIQGAERANEPNWFSSSEHKVTLNLNGIIPTREARFLQDENAGMTNYQNQMLANEVKFYGKVVTGIINQITNQIQKSYFHDADGNLTQIITKRNGQIETTENFGYTMNRLTSYAKLNSQGTIISKFKYVYSPTGQRIKKINELQTVEEKYYYDGQDVIEDNQDSQTNVYVGLSEIDEKLVKIAENGDRTFFLQDHVGTNIQNYNGSTISDFITNAWGELIFGERVGRYGFAQREFDEENGIYYFRARHYEPKIGRFIQKDPITNKKPLKHYLYANNDPINKKDPFGDQEIIFVEEEIGKWIEYAIDVASQPLNKIIDYVEESVYPQSLYPETGKFWTDFYNPRRGFDQARGFLYGGNEFLKFFYADLLTGALLIKFSRLIAHFITDPTQTWENIKTQVTDYLKKVTTDPKETHFLFGYIAFQIFQMIVTEGAGAAVSAEVATTRQAANLTKLGSNLAKTSGTMTLVSKTPSMNKYIEFLRTYLLKRPKKFRKSSLDDLIERFGKKPLQHDISHGFPNKSIENFIAQLTEKPGLLESTLKGLGYNIDEMLFESIRSFYLKSYSYSKNLFYESSLINQTRGARFVMPPDFK